MGRKKIKIDWLNHALEFIVVIAGILIAFELNEYSKLDGQKETIKIHLKQIHEETLLNKYFLERSISFAEDRQLKLDSIIKLISRKENYEVVNQLSIDLLNLGGVYIRKNAYHSLFESGDIRLIKEIEVKQNIVNLYEYYEWVESFNEISYNLYSGDYYPYLRDNFDLVNNTVQPDEVYESLIFSNILGAYWRTSANRLKKYKEGLAEVEKYLEENKLDQNSDATP